jgi:AcrR family transcriptional regulator
MLKTKPQRSDLRRKLPNQNRAKRTVAKITASAESILGKEGINGLTMRKIATTAGISVGLAYDYYPSKQAVLYQIYERRLNEQLKMFDKAFGDDLGNTTFTQAFQHYLSLQRAAHYPSPVDLALSNAIDRDHELARMTRHFEEALTDRYIRLLHNYGSTWSNDDLRRLAAYAHQVDQMNLKLQASPDGDTRKFYGDLTTMIFYIIVQYSGASTGK